MKIRSFSKEQRGATVAEFAIIASVFFMMIFGIIEFGRLLYTHNALTDAARRGARYAALHPESLTCVKNVTVFGEKHIDPVTCAPMGPPLINNLSDTNVRVTYVGADLDDNPGTPQTAYGMNLGTATVKIENFTFDLNVPLFQFRVNMPTYTTTLTAESAGLEPDPI